eukprot:TRINITY_DN9994_c0_g1_i1.p1 TRINITY_DN9994_c0_g1~~TRINITY_DN9994_c0_g1_i1.p1  ORF type:complete len:159 (-),score=56.30 TRINITY_DN9994_c0_g1_i1:38-514(-)
MPNFGIFIKCNLENVTNLRPLEEGMRWYVNMNGPDGQLHDKEVYISAEEEHENPAGRGTINFIIRAKGNKKAGTVNVVPVADQSYGDDDEPEWKLFAQFDCRACEPIQWNVTEGLLVDSVETGKTYEVVIEDGVWVDYDDDAGVSLGIYDFETKIERV